MEVEQMQAVAGVAPVIVGVSKVDQELRSARGYQPTRMTRQRISQSLAVRGYFFIGIVLPIEFL